ncbi:MAG TPA: hypothetical protein VME67_19535 [Mycobacterium sp.]|nr:hypothetical protein [Mycobacterium sp.]HTX96850.1 hypothetical protein [Mycobacterium sp.]
MGLHPQGDAFESAVAEALARRTAEHAKATPAKKAARIDRPLVDAERWLLLDLAARAIAEQIGCSLALAGDALKLAAEQGQLIIAGGAVDVQVSVYGKPLVHASREWLAFNASWPGDDPWRDQKWLT